MKILSKFSSSWFSRENKVEEESKSDSSPMKTDIYKAPSKNNVHNIYNRTENYIGATNTLFSTNQSKVNRFIEFGRILNEPIVDIEDLKKLSWDGIAPTLRCDVWKLLLNYIPQNKSNVESILALKRQEYINYVQQHFPSDVQSQLDDRIYNEVRLDVKRTQPTYPLFQDPIIQNLLFRLLYIWSFRKPVVFYVQGVNDIATPLIAVFLSEYIDLDWEKMAVSQDLSLLSKEILLKVEADTFWCMNLILDKIIDNYTNDHPGVVRALSKVQKLIEKIDPQLSNHLRNQKLTFMQFAFRWVFCLFVREFPLQLVIRIFDSYISEDSGFSTLHPYVIAAVILKFAQKLKTMPFNQMISFLQRIPTDSWTQDDINMLLAESFVYMSMFENSQGHIKYTPTQ